MHRALMTNATCLHQSLTAREKLPVHDSAPSHPGQQQMMPAVPSTSKDPHALDQPAQQPGAVCTALMPRPRSAEGSAREPAFLSPHDSSPAPPACALRQRLSDTAALGWASSASAPRAAVELTTRSWVALSGAGAAKGMAGSV